MGVPALTPKLVGTMGAATRSEVVSQIGPRKRIREATTQGSPLERSPERKETNRSIDEASNMYRALNVLISSSKS